MSHLIFTSSTLPSFLQSNTQIFCILKNSVIFFFQFQVYCLASMLTFSVFNHCLSLTVYFLTRGGSRPWAKKGRGGWLFVACSANFSSVCKFFLTQNKGGGGGPLPQIHHCLPHQTIYLWTFLKYETILLHR